MSTIAQEEDKVSYKTKQYLPYRIERKMVYLEFVRSPLLKPTQRSSNTELMQVRSFLTRGIMVSSALSAFLTSMTLLKIFEESVSIPLLAACLSILIAFVIERKKKRI